jgi:LacI family transcriptional regulator
MVRLKDIAARAGVSIMTVSKCLRDAPDISAGTKARVRQMAEAMGYVPHAMAASLRTRNTRLFGLVISTITNPIYARVVLAIMERAHELGYDLIVTQTLNSPEREELCIRRLMARRIEGIFISPVYRLQTEAPIYQQLWQRQIPVVLLDHRAPFCQPFANVEVDNLIAAFKLTQHLLQLGHRQIAYFTGPATAPSSQERFEGHRRALRELGVEVEDRFVFNAGSTIEDGVKAATQFLNEAPSVTAIMAVNDLVAIGAANTLLDQGVCIPADLSVTGFGNILAAETYRTPLTTVRQPKYHLGLAAMDLMLQLLQGKPVEHKRLPGEIIVRASTSAPAGKPPA